MQNAFTLVQPSTGYANRFQAAGLAGSQAPYLPAPKQVQLSNSRAKRQAMKVDPSILATIIGVIATAVLGIIAFEAKGMRSDIDGLRAQINSNHVELIGKIDALDKNFSVAIGHLQDIKANIRR